MHATAAMPVLDAIPVLAELARCSRLSRPQRCAAYWLAADHSASRGSTACTTGAYDGQPRAKNVQPGVSNYRVSEAAVRLGRLQEFMRRHERATMAALMHPTAKPWDVLMQLGAASGYSQRDAVRGAGVATVQALLETVADFYRAHNWSLTQHAEAA